MSWPPETLKLFSLISSQRALPPLPADALPTVPYAMLSYAGAGEDMLLAKRFKQRLRERRPGVYVDVGAGACFAMSNTYAFYAHGWRGLCIDPNPAAAPEWAHHRPRDIFVPAAVAAAGERAQWFEHRENWGMSQIAATAEPLGPDYKAPREVAVRRLDVILNEHLPDTEIQFLTIDVEGAELSVLQSSDWKRWRPEAVLLECKDFSFAAPLASAPVRFLAERGYDLAAKVGENVMLVRA